MTQRDGTHASYAHARWEARYHDVLAGVAPAGFTVAEWRAVLEEQGRLHGYLKEPTEREKANAAIREEIRRRGEGVDDA